MENFLQFFDCNKQFQIKNIIQIKKPRDFHEKIIESLQNANDVFIITLYIGSLKKSKEIMREIQYRVIEKKNIQIIIDYNRNHENRQALALIKKFQIEQVVFFANKKSHSILPPLIREFFKVLHIKIYIFDSQVIISGANLDDKYFSTRLDRYFVINDYNLTINLYNEIFLRIAKEQKFTEILAQKLKKSICYNKNFEIKNNNAELKNTVIIPYCNHEELSICQKIFNYDFESFYLSTAYINFPEKYIDFLKIKQVTIIIPNTECNTFKGNGLFNNLVCKIYDFFAIEAKKKLPNSRILTFFKKKSSFHIKGIWAFHSNFAISVIGSTNFNERSYKKDQELNFLLVTKDKQIIEIFKQEKQYLIDHSEIIHIKPIKNILAIFISYFFKQFF